MCRVSAGLCIWILLAAANGCGKGSPSLPKNLSIDLGGGLAIELVLINPGYFMMGSDKGAPDEQPVHKVTIARPFYMGKYEVTQEQWLAVMGANPSHFKGEKNPVENVSWDDCQEFLKKLSKKKKGRVFKLPTEAQWEYACRAGSATDYTFGDDASRLGEYAWFGGINSPQTTHPVGQKKPNAWDLSDMHGNVWEWCMDRYASTYADGDAATSPDLERVLRGGSWGSDSQNLRSARRSHREPGYRNRGSGFRLCLDSQ